MADATTSSVALLSAFEYTLDSAAAGSASTSGGSAAASKKKKRVKKAGAKLHVESATTAIEADDDGDEDDASYADVSRASDAAPDAAAASVSRAAGADRATWQREPGAPVTLAAYKAAIADIIKEFLLEEDYDECRLSLEELEAPSFGFEFVRRLVMLSMERSDRDRELASRVLSFLYGTDISMEQIGKGFERLFEGLDDLCLDVPDARAHCAKFLARAVADEILPPAYLADPYICSLAGDVIGQARALLSVKMSAAKLEHVWHVTGVFTVPQLKAAIKESLEEFLVSHQRDEVLRCVCELHTPHFAHEVVYRGVVLTLSAWPAVEALDRMAALIAFLNEQDALTEGQVVKGFQRVYANMGDLVLDNPHAQQACDMLLDKVIAHGAVSARYAAMMQAASATSAIAGTPHAGGASSVAAAAAASATASL